MKYISGGVCAAKGYIAGGIHCGIRKNKTKRDLAMIKSEVKASAAAVYTQNLVKGAPITVTKNNIADGLKSNDAYSSQGIYLYTYKPDSVSWNESNYAISAMRNIIIRNNNLKHYGKGIQSAASGCIGFIIDGNILEDCGNNNASGNTIYLIAQAKSVKIINNICKRCGALYVATGLTIAGFVNLLDILSDLFIAGNSFIDPYISTRVVSISTQLRGLIYKDNVIDDSQTNRTTTYAYVYIQGAVTGGVMCENFIYTKTQMTAFYAITSSNTLVFANNYSFINNEFIENRTT